MLRPSLANSIKVALFDRYGPIHGRETNQRRAAPELDALIVIIEVLARAFAARAAERRVAPRFDQDAGRVIAGKLQSERTVGRSRLQSFATPGIAG